MRIAEEPSDLFWIPTDCGGLVIQWVGVDSLKDLIAFGEKVVAANEWKETLDFTIVSVKAPTPYRGVRLGFRVPTHGTSFSQWF